ncbi:hypothetical protein M5E06_32545 [Azospirillum sp. A1-3]|uniref:hypothetical protein n=1 Tax=Azospirillum sp. A1-3 TaxID=185874 RepID=UPI0020778AEA|nr:hypothetical protein [Azospirillum sp. A1-3]MCM8738822.1 hypothetical protein [Azospirillum sp. A1-3]
MGTFLTESVPVSLSGALGDVGKFKLYACDQPNVILYVTKQPVLSLDRQGKPGVAVTTYTAQQPDHSVKIIGGAATIGLNTSPQLDQASIDQAKALVASLGVGDPNRLRFLPLTTQKGKALLNLPPTAGKPDQKHNERDVGTPGGSLSFLAELSESGALEWSNAIRNQSRVNGDITIEYEYLRRVPDIGAEVRVHGQRVFEHLSAELATSYNGFFYGGSAKIQAAWDALSRNGGVEVVFLNQGLPPDLEKLRQEMVTTFAKQAMQILFDQIFAPMPQVAPAEAGHSGGLFGGANFALKWQKKTDAIEMIQKIEFRGTTWLKDTMDISLAALFSDLDASCLTEVPAQQAFDSVVLVDADPMLANAAASMSWDRGHSPEAPVFTKDGGNQRYTVISTDPRSVNVTCDIKINYSPPRWPVIPYKQVKTVGDGGNQMVIKTSAWVGRQTIFMFLREGNRIIPPQDLTPDDYLILNVSYAGPHLPTAVRDSAHIDAMTPIDFAYPLDPQGRLGVAKFSAFGVIGGQLKRAPEQVIPPTDSAVFILATRGGDIQLVTSEAVLGESDNLAQELIQGQGHPLISRAGSPSSETTKKGKGTGGNGKDGIITGHTAGIEYGVQGTYLWIRADDGSSRRLHLHSVQDALPFERESKLVKVELDPSGEYAESIFVDLVGA